METFICHVTGIISKRSKVKVCIVHIGKSITSKMLDWI